MTIANKLNKLLETKENIRQAIIDKGVEVSENTIFADYPSKINSIEAGGGDSGESVWNMVTNNGTRGQYLFYGCESLTDLDLSSFDTSNVTVMSYMFAGCKKLTSLNISNWNTSNATLMFHMFESCESLTDLDLSNFNTSNVTDMGYMFYNCKKLTLLDVSSFNTSNITNTYYMFYNCQALTQLDLSSFNTSNITSMSNTFYGCKALTSLNMSNCDISKCTSSSALSSMFGSSSSNSCIALVDLQAPKNINANLSLQYCTALSHDSLMSVINNLMTVTSTKTLTLGATNLAKLSDEEKAIATNKGWALK